VVWNIEKNENEKVMPKVHRYAHGRGRNYDLTYGLIRRRFVRVFSRVQGQVVENWLRASAKSAFSRTERVRMLELDRRLKGCFIRLCAYWRTPATHTRDTHWRYFMQIPCETHQTWSYTVFAMIVFLPKYRRPCHFNSMFILLVSN